MKSADRGFLVSKNERRFLISGKPLTYHTRMLIVISQNDSVATYIPFTAMNRTNFWDSKYGRHPLALGQHLFTRSRHFSQKALRLHL